MSQVVSGLRSAWLAWNRFWFEVQDLEGLCLFRALFCAALTYFYSIRHAGLEIFYFDSGLMPLVGAREFLPEFFRSPLPLFFHSDVAVLWGHRAFLLVLLLLTLGIGGRLLAIAALLLHVGFLQRNYSLVYGADLVTTFWLFYLSLADNCRHYSVLNYWRPQTRHRVGPLSSLAVRLIQVQLCVIYFYTGCEKLKGASWWDGTAMWRVLGNPQLAPMDFSFMAHFPWVIAAMTYSAMLFEIYFPVMVINKKVRGVWLSLGVIFHLSTAVLMSLTFFALAMILPYLVFLNKYQLERLLRFIRLRPAAT